MKRHNYLMILSLLSILFSTLWFIVQKSDKLKEGNMEIIVGDYESAADKFEQVTIDVPDDARAFNDLGVANHHLKKYDLAIKNYTRAIELYPNYIIAIANRGISKNDQGNFEDALIDYNKAISLAPDYENSYNNRGNTYRNIGDYEKAIQDFKSAHKINPHLAKAVGNLMTTYKELGDCKEVIKWSDYYIENFPTRKGAYRIRAECKEQIGDKDGAHSDFLISEKIINQRDPNELKELNKLKFWNAIFATLGFIGIIGVLISLQMRRKYT